jgi:transcriptional regulator of arginine metabolism
MPSKGESWSERQDAVRRILADEGVRNQTELLKRLQKRGFRVTQSSVSRDLQELGAVKVGGRYVARETLAGRVPARGGLEEIAGSILQVRPAGPNILVVLTPPGRASTVALILDGAEWSEIVGTVAGDDTLFVATTGHREQAKVAARLEALTGRAQKSPTARAASAPQPPAKEAPHA